jgi:alpha-N-arabinofuranosidase
MVSRAALLALAWLSTGLLEPLRHAAAAQPARGVAILQVDTDRHLGTIDRRIYGQFLKHINHSVVDGLFAEQIRGAGFEGKDFETYWTSFASPLSATRPSSTSMAAACGRSLPMP